MNSYFGRKREFEVRNALMMDLFLLMEFRVHGGRCNNAMSALTYIQTDHFPASRQFCVWGAVSCGKCPPPHSYPMPTSARGCFGSHSARLIYAIYRTKQESQPPYHPNWRATGCQAGKRPNTFDPTSVSIQNSGLIVNDLSVHTYQCWETYSETEACEASSQASFKVVQ